MKANESECWMEWILNKSEWSINKIDENSYESMVL